MPDAPTPLDLDAIRARANAATEGPWTATQDTCWGETYPSLSIQRVYEYTDYDPARAGCEPLDAEEVEFIAHARTDVPALVAEVERLRARVSGEPGECVMTHTPPFDFAQCETHDETFPLGAACKFHGRTSVAEVYADEADRMRARAVLAEEEVEHLRAEVARAARPAPAWDEDAIKAAIRAAAGHVLTNVSNYPDAAHATLLGGDLSVVIDKTAEAVLAVVREHLLVRPDRETIARAIFDAQETRAAAPLGDEPEAWESLKEVDRDDYRAQADAVLDLFPGRSEAEVKAEALREAARAYRKHEDEGYLFLAGSWLRVPWEAVARDLVDRADRLAAEGGDDRG